MKKKTKVIIIVLAIIALAVICGAVWWFTPTRFLNRIEPSEIASIEVFNGNDGNEFVIRNPDDIEFISSHIKAVPMKKSRISMGMGTTYNLCFLNENGSKIDKFIIMSPTTIKSGIVFYKCDGELQQVEDYLIELEKAQFPDTYWIENQNS